MPFSSREICLSGSCQGSPASTKSLTEPLPCLVGQDTCSTWPQQQECVHLQQEKRALCSTVCSWVCLSVDLEQRKIATHPPLCFFCEESLLRTDITLCAPVQVPQVFKLVLLHAKGGIDFILETDQLHGRLGSFRIKCHYSSLKNSSSDNGIDLLLPGCHCLCYSVSVRWAGIVSWLCVTTPINGKMRTRSGAGSGKPREVNVASVH